VTVVCYLLSETVAVDSWQKFNDVVAWVADCRQSCQRHCHSRTSLDRCGSLPRRPRPSWLVWRDFDKDANVASDVRPCFPRGRGWYVLLENRYEASGIYALLTFIGAFINSEVDSTLSTAFTL